METQYSGPITTANSASEGRLKVGVGCPHGKKKCLKCAIKPKDGKGGSSMPKLNFPIGTGGYGAYKTGGGKPSSTPVVKKKSGKLKKLGALKKGGSLGKMKFKKMKSYKIKKLKSIIRKL